MDYKYINTERSIFDAGIAQGVRNGVSKNRLSFTGAGGSNPTAPFEDRPGWWKNRRVDFILVK